ncbi:MAG: hypothetical protein EOP89_02120 [Lysobacteraceae bacterium]|nr:MAG: hypothetical protein EOP89_02120 [Xanthomonadaceae bacterium]
MERNAATSVSFRLDGGDGCLASVSLIRTGRRELPGFVVETATGDRIRAHHTSADRIDFHVPASGGVTIRWKEDAA